VVGITLFFGGGVGILVFSIRAELKEKEAESRARARRELAAQSGQLAERRAQLAKGCPKCGGQLGVGLDTPLERVRAIVDTRCFYCGALLPEIDGCISSDSGASKCSHCGAPLDANAAKCFHCGTEYSLARPGASDEALEFAATHSCPQCRGHDVLNLGNNCIICKNCSQVFNRWTHRQVCLAPRATNVKPCPRCGDRGPYRVSKWLYPEPWWGLETAVLCGNCGVVYDAR